MIVKSISKRLENYNEIKSSLIELFPKNELYPFWFLRLLAFRLNASFLAYYDNGDYIGLSFTYKYKDLVFILYLGVKDNVQSKGYGSKILNLIKLAYPNSTFVLNVEPLDMNADNFLQREKRFAFYNKNGFINTGYSLHDDINYQILSTDKLDIKKYKKLLRKFSFNLNNPKFISD